MATEQSGISMSFNCFLRSRLGKGDCWLEICSRVVTMTLTTAPPINSVAKNTDRCINEIRAQRYCISSRNCAANHNTLPTNEKGVLRKLRRSQEQSDDILYGICLLREKRMKDKRGRKQKGWNMERTKRREEKQRKLN